MRTECLWAAAREHYDYAVSLEQKGSLTCLSRIPQGGMVLEVWSLRGLPEKPSATAPNPSAVIAKVKRLLRNIIPERPVTSGPVAADFERGKLLLKPAGNRWREVVDRGALRLELPVTLTSEYRALHFKGSVDPKPSLVVVGGKEAGRARVRLAFPTGSVVLAPGVTAKGALEVVGLSRPGLFTPCATELALKIAPCALGVGTTDATLFQARDPVAVAKVTGVLWVEPCRPAVALSPERLPPLPVLSPPRGVQALLVVVAILLVALLGKAALPKPVPPLSVYYRTEGVGVAQTATLRTAGATCPLSGVSAVIQRSSTASAITVRPDQGATLLNAAGEGKSELSFTQGGRFIVKGADGRLTAVNFDFGKEPAGPTEPAQGEGFMVEDTQGDQPRPTSRAAEDEWGLGEGS